jgi:hypothetical protein
VAPLPVQEHEVRHDPVDLAVEFPHPAEPGEFRPLALQLGRFLQEIDLDLDQLREQVQILPHFRARALEVRPLLLADEQQLGDLLRVAVRVHRQLRQAASSRWASCTRAKVVAGARDRHVDRPAVPADRRGDHELERRMRVPDAHVGGGASGPRRAGLLAVPALRSVGRAADTTARRPRHVRRAGEGRATEQGSGEGADGGPSACA